MTTFSLYRREIKIRMELDDKRRNYERIRRERGVWGSQINNDPSIIVINPISKQLNILIQKEIQF